jgi:hypothetical protein
MTNIALCQSGQDRSNLWIVLISIVFKIDAYGVMFEKS